MTPHFDGTFPHVGQVGHVRVSELPTLNQEQNVAFDILDLEPSRTEVEVVIEPAKVVDAFEIVVAVDLVNHKH